MQEQRGWVVYLGIRIAHRWVRDRPPDPLRALLETVVGVALAVLVAP